MADEIDIPKVGKLPKKYVYVIGGGAIAFIGWKYWQNRQSAATETPTVTPPVEDTFGGTGSDSSAGFQYAGSGNTSTSSVDTTTNPTTNQQWTQNAVAYADSLGYSTAAVAAAIGKYLRSEALTTTEQTYIKTVLAGVGSPPVGGPFTIITDTSTSTSKLPAPTNLKVTKAGTDYVNLSWTQVSGASSYRIYRTDTKTAAQVATGGSTSVYGLRPNTSYQFWIAAADSSGNVGAVSSKVTTKTAAVTLKAPTGLKATPGAGTMMLKWNAVPGADYYRIYVNNIAHGASDTPTYNVVSLKHKTVYSFKVAADTTTGAPGPASATIKAKTK